MTSDQPDNPAEPADLTARLAHASQDQRSDLGVSRSPELNEQRSDRVERALDSLATAFAADLAVADVGNQDLPTPPRLTAMVRGTDGEPLDRDEYAESLRVELELHGGRASGYALAERSVRLSDAQAQVAAALLDELAGVYRDEDLGRLAREVAVVLYDRLGI